MTPFEHAVADVRSGRVGVHEAAERLVDELTDPELLGVLDGDTPLLTGLRQLARHGYNHRPYVAGEVVRLGIPGIRFTDGPRGIVMGRSTGFPVAIARGATWDVGLEEEVGRAIAVEGRAQGANLFAGICVNVLRHPAWGRSQETYGEDPVHLGRMGAAATRGVRTHLMACVKHFALNSMENSRFQVDVTVDDDVLHETYLPHFRTVLEAGADAVMAAYNAVNGTWCGDHPELLTEVLRDEWGFDGFVMSDFLFGHRDPVGSVAAGLDLEMPFVQQRGAALPAALTDGSLRRSDARRAAGRLVAAQVRWAASTPVEAPSAESVAGDEHRALARRVAARSMVLLRNEPIAGAPVLPLSPAHVRSLALLGRLADAENQGDTGSSQVHPPEVTTVLAGLRSAYGDDVVRHATGEDRDEAVRLARTSDVAVVVVGLTPDDEGEAVAAMDRDTLGLLPDPAGSALLGRLNARVVSAATRRFGGSGGSGGDRDDLGLRDEDVALVRAVAAVNPRTVVVIIAGGTVLMEDWRTLVPVVLLTWYPGMEGGHALADVLTGRVEPGGRLPFAIPTDPAHLPHFDHDARTIHYDRWYGQRRLDRDGRAAAYPLGFGLGYRDLRVDEAELLGVDTEALTARVRAEVADVTEQGAAARHGSATGTVVQVYAVGRAGPQRPTRQLVGFARVEVPAGGREQVDVDLDLRPVARRDAATRRWEIVPAPYVLEIGRWCGDPQAVRIEWPIGDHGAPPTET